MSFLFMYNTITEEVKPLDKPEETVAWFAVAVPGQIFFEADICALENEEPAVVRHYQKDLAGLNKNGHPCEVCHHAMDMHVWADLDVNGFVVECSINS